MQIGIADSEDGPTGATVLLFSRPVMAAVDTQAAYPA